MRPRSDDRCHAKPTLDVRSYCQNGGNGEDPMKPVNAERGKSIGAINVSIAMIAISCYFGGWTCDSQPN